MGLHRNPRLTVDVIIETGEGIVLVERKFPPPGWAIPGGFVEEGEPVEEAALREMKEETGLTVLLTDLLYVYSDPRRDPRHHTATVVFVGRPADPKAPPVAGDDAGKAQLFPAEAPPKPMAFDHARVLADYRTWKASGKRPAPMEQLTIWRAKKPIS